jgi:hypothetical protein
MSCKTIKLDGIGGLKHMVKSLRPVGAVANLLESLNKGDLKPENFSVQDLFVALHESGAELLHMISSKKSGGMPLLEAAQAVDTAAFTGIIGQIVFNKVKDAYSDPEFLWPDLVETMNSQFLDGERIPGIGRIGDKAEIVDEAASYPLVGLNEEFIDTPPSRKRGMIVPVTREIIVADRTGILLKAAGETGRWMGLNKEKRVLNVVTGQTNNYKRNGTATNTYLTSGAYINSQTGNALDTSGNEWRALEKADLLFDAITDPNTGEPIIVKPDSIVVPTALLRTAQRILGGTGIVTVDNRANAGTIRTESPNPYGGKNIKVLSSPYVKLASSSATKWWWGTPKKAFLYIQIWDIETLQAASNNELEFSQDIWMRYKVSERGVCAVQEPRFMVQNDT